MRFIFLVYQWFLPDASACVRACVRACARVRARVRACVCLGGGGALSGVTYIVNYKYLYYIGFHNIIISNLLICNNYENNIEHHVKVITRVAF